MGLYVSETVLFVFFLALFCAVTARKVTPPGSTEELPWTIYDEPNFAEVLLWFCNLGYTIFEIWDCSTHPQGIKGYFGEWTNWFDSALVAIFCFMGGLRYSIRFSFRFDNCNLTDPGFNRANDPNCDKDTWPNLIFVICWSISAILLWLRMLQVFSISRSVGPFIRMIGNLYFELVAFLKIFGLFTFAFVFAGLFVSVEEIPEFKTIPFGVLTIFRASIGEYPMLDEIGYNDQNGDLNVRYIMINILSVTWMLVGTILLLNLLIALMAKTFDDLSELNNQQVIFSMTQRAYDLDASAAVMPPRLVYIIYIINLYKNIHQIFYNDMYSC